MIRVRYDNGDARHCAAFGHQRTLRKKRKVISIIKVRITQRILFMINATNARCARRPFRIRTGLWWTVAFPSTELCYTNHVIIIASIMRVTLKTFEILILRRESRVEQYRKTIMSSIQKYTRRRVHNVNNTHSAGQPLLPLL